MEDASGAFEIKNCTVESCGVDLWYATVSRQAGTRVSCDPDVMNEFAEFTGWAIESIVERMQQRGFRISHSPIEQKEYFDHVGLKDKWKAEKYRQCYPKDVLRKNRSNMFVKTGESHSVIFSKTGENNRD